MISLHYPGVPFPAVEGKGGYGSCDFETGKKSLIREIQKNELDNRVVMATRLMDW